MLFGRYDRIVDQYATMWPLLVPGYLPILNAMRSLVQALPQRPGRVLDLGCGPGSATVAVAPVCSPEAKVTLVDGSAAMVRAAQAILGDHVERALVGDFTSGRFIHEIFDGPPFDLALCSFALHHIDDSQKVEAVDHIAAMLQPGGALLLADEVAVDRPAGQDIVERVRARIIHEHMSAGRITREFWERESALEPELRLPFLPARMEDLSSWMARSGLGVTCPVSVFGSALLVGIKPGG